MSALPPLAPPPVHGDVGGREVPLDLPLVLTLGDDPAALAAPAALGVGLVQVQRAADAQGAQQAAPAVAGAGVGVGGGAVGAGHQLVVAGVAARGGGRVHGLKKGLR